MPKLKKGDASKAPPAAVSPEAPICVVTVKAAPVPIVNFPLPVIVPWNKLTLNVGI